MKYHDPQASDFDNRLHEINLLNYPNIPKFRPLERRNDGPPQKSLRNY